MIGLSAGTRIWLAAGSERADRRAAIERQFATAKLNGLGPALWLADTLDKLPTCPNSKIDPCYRSQTLHKLKCRWKVCRPAASRRARI